MLRVCHEQQFLTREHVRAFFPENSSGREARRRVGELERAGLLRRIPCPVQEGTFLVRTTAQGRAFAVNEGSPHIRPISTLAAATLLHDALVTSVRLRLRHLWSARFIPERAMKEGDYPTIPDGVFVFASGKAVALEVENSDKGVSRFRRLAARWNDVAAIDAILYVTRDEELKTKLQYYLKGASTTKPLGVLAWPALRVGRPKVWTLRGEFPWLDRREF
ncbi:MAG: replication-relaxation family protein [Bdellovibrionales bacterium]|nr:replication-relaxation family protein [Bdellovibrionales bacterium]